MKKRLARFVLLIILITLLAACGGEAADEAPTTAATAESPTAAPAPTEPPAPAPTEAAPTEAPPATMEHTEEAAPTPALPRVGILRYHDTETTRSGGYQLQMIDVPPPPGGNHYELWLFADDGAPLNLGPVEIVDGVVNQSGETEENLIGRYSFAQVTVQPDGETSSAPGEAAFNALVAADTLIHIRHVVFEFPANPDGQGFLIGAEAQAALAAQHAGLSLEALTANDLDGAKQHAEHVINILDGEAGEFYGDYTGDDVAQNPGDGFGVRAYLLGAQEHALLASEAEGATDEIRLHAEHVRIASANALTWLDEAIDEALHVISADTIEEAQPFGEAAVQLTTDMTAGRDADGDGAAAPVEGEGAIDTAYEHGLYMGGLELYATVAQTPTTEQPAATEEPAAEPPAAPGEVFIDMTNFAFSEATLTIPVGTTVTWRNLDTVQHSATADDGSFDTGLFDGGAQASVTFDTPGEFAYYCLLHGGPGGTGMSARIVVVEEGAAAPPPEEPAGQEFVIDMANFAFSEATLTIPVGSTVVWRNLDTVQHSATADDGSFDTGLLDGGGEARVTFSTPGTFPYYCLLHGGPGGVGMSATIVVTDG